MDFMQVVGVTYFIDVIQVYPAFFYVQEWQVVLDYGGYNTIHHKVLHKQQLHVHGHVKQVDDVQVQVALLLIQIQLLVKVNKKLKLFFHNHFVQVHYQMVQSMMVLDLCHRLLVSRSIQRSYWNRIHMLNLS